MNQPEDPKSEPGTPRWLNDANARGGLALPAHESAVLREVLGAIRRVSHGSVLLSLQDGRVVQVEVTEKKRL